MKNILIVSIALLLLWGCSEKDDDDKSLNTQSQLVESSDSGKIEPSPVKEDNEVKESKLSDAEVEEIKKAFSAAEKKVTEKIQIKFNKVGATLKATIGKRCETADVNEIKECLELIKNSLESFIKEGDNILGESDDSRLKEELVKIDLSSEWLIKINKSINMAR